MEEEGKKQNQEGKLSSLDRIDNRKVLSDMESQEANKELVPEKFEDVKDEAQEGNKELLPERIEDVKDEGPKFHCEQSDIEVVHKIAQMLLPGLATACVDNTTGAFFASPGSVAADLRKGMEDYLTQRSETFVAETVVLEGGAEAEVSDDPYDIISNFVDDFTTSKRTLFGRVSTWLLSDQREDKIDDFVQGMEMNGFWMIDRRTTLAQTLLKNVDFKTSFHCDQKFNSLEELTEHLPQCKYRSMPCQNEGCDAIFSACRLENHDSTCPFKFIPCEQNCSQILMRREMDRHCITVCPMRLVNCPFHSVGCQSAIPHCKIEEHRSSDLHSHLLYILQGIYKEASEDDLKQRIDQLEKASSSNQLANARDIRSLTSIVKGLESKLGPMEFSVKRKAAVEDNIENKDNSNSHNIEKKDEGVENRGVMSINTENRDVRDSNHIDNSNVNNHNQVEKEDSSHSNDVESKDSKNTSTHENMHGNDSSNIERIHGSNSSNTENKDDSNSGNENTHSSNSSKVKNNDGTNSSDIENKHVGNISDMESSQLGSNSSNIEIMNSNHISHVENKKADDNSENSTVNDMSNIEHQHGNNISNIGIRDGTEGSKIENKHGINSSNIENKAGSDISKVEDELGDDSPKVENRDGSNIGSFENTGGNNINNIKKGDTTISNIEDRDSNYSRNVDNNGGENSREINERNSDDSKVDNRDDNSNSIENMDSEEEARG